MKRKIIVTTPEHPPSVRVVATINSVHRALTRDEVEKIRNELADRLQEAVAHLIYLQTPVNWVKIR